MMRVPLASGWSINAAAYSIWLLVLAVAGIFSKWEWRRPIACMQALGLLVLPGLIYGVAYSGLYLTQYLVAFVILMIASKAPRWMVAMTATLILGCGALHFATDHYLQVRWQAFLSPESYSQTEGYQLYQSTIAIRDAGWWGHGLGSSLNTVPDITDEFVFSYLIYSLGWLPGICVFLLVVFFTVRLHQTNRQIRDRYGSLVMTGLVTVFTYQFFWNILMTLGLLPTSAISLPFISYGGSQTLLQLLLLGFALNIYRRKDLLIAN